MQFVSKKIKAMMDDIEKKSDKIIKSSSVYLVCINFFDQHAVIDSFAADLFKADQCKPVFVYVIGSKLYILYDSCMYDGSTQRIVSVMTARASLFAKAVCDCHIVEFEHKTHILAYIACVIQDSIRKRAGLIDKNLAMHEVILKYKDWNTLDDKHRYGYFNNGKKSWSMMINFENMDQQYAMLFR
jgi:hypothetical protein